jgi:4-hydroxy-tetrahydrodipicolinate reductase
MKIALLGKGKTGMHFKTLAESRDDTEVIVFDRNNTPDADRLAGHDVVVSFFPGNAFARYIPKLVESGLPVVTGSTGFEWPGGRDAFSRLIAGKNLIWIHGNNFSPGMALVHSMIGILGNAGRIFDKYQFDLHEVHHTAKLDAPSGTALAWKEWTGEPVSITSERTGDVTGIHTLTLGTPFENISITHEALDRSLFASGAMRAVELLLNEVTVRDKVEVEVEVEAASASATASEARIGPGLHDFQEIIMQLLMSESGTGESNAPRNRNSGVHQNGKDSYPERETSARNPVETAGRINRQNRNSNG